MSTPAERVRLLLEQAGDTPAERVRLLLEGQQVAPRRDPSLIEATVAGFIRGTTDPLTLIPSVRAYNERLKEFKGTTLPDRLGYGLGYIGGMFLPATAAYRVAGAAVSRVPALVAKLATADRAADLTRLGKFTRGALAGALYGGGQHAEDMQEWSVNVASNAAIGGAADIVIPAAMSALASRWGNRVSPKIEEVIDQAYGGDVTSPLEAAPRISLGQVAGAVDLPPAGLAEAAAGAVVRSKQNPVGVRLHAQAMALLDQTDKLTATKEQWTLYRQLKKVAPELDPRAPLSQQEIRQTVAELSGAGVDDYVIDQFIKHQGSLQPWASKRMSLRLGLQQLNLPEILPGEVRVIPAPHGDVAELSKLLKKVDGLDHATVTRGAEQFAIIGLKNTADFKTLAAGMKDNGFMRGQELLFNGEKWIALKPTTKGDKLWVTQPGRAKPRQIEKRRAEFLPVVQDIGTAPVARVAPLAADFIEKYGIWPGEAPGRGLGPVSQAAAGALDLAVPEPPVGFLDAFRRFAGERGLTAGERLGVLSRLRAQQKAALVEEDSWLGKALDAQDEAAAATMDKEFPDGIITELSAQRGVTYRQEFKDGRWWYVFNDETSKPISTPLLGEDNAVEWLHNYTKELDDLVDDASPLVEGVVRGGGPPAQVPHTAGELSGYPAEQMKKVQLSWLANISERLNPRAQYIRFAEDTFKKAGVAFNPYTEMFLPLLEKRPLFLNEHRTWLKGGTLPDGTKYKGLLRIIDPSRPKVRDAFREKVVDLMESPRSTWTSRAKEWALNDSEVQTAKDLREFFDTVFNRFVKDPEIDITADDFIENYFPHYRKLSDAEAPRSMELVFKDKTRINKPAQRFLSEMQRKGTMTKWDKDPFVVALKYLRAGLYKSHMKATVDEVIEKVNAIPVVSQDVAQVKRSLIEYVQMTSFAPPEAFSSVNLGVTKFLKNMGIDLGESDQDRLINTLMSLNYGAYLAFRPALVVRQLSQMFITGYPVLGGKYMAYGLKSVIGGGGQLMTDLKRLGVITEQAIQAPGVQDAMYELAHTARATAGGQLSKLKRGALRATEIGMKGFAKGDDINRAVVFAGQKRKAIDAFNLLAEGKITEAKAIQKAGLNYFGPSVTEEFLKRRTQHGMEASAEWLGKIAAWDTQWIYSLGAGPALFSHGVGRLMGQYGTWPMWYAAYLSQGLKNLKGIDRAMFVARNAAVNTGIVLAGREIGLNLSRWTGLSSLSWFGGPAVDMFADVQDIVTGLTNEGEATAGRSIALSNFSLRDTGEGVSMLPEFLGGRITWATPSPENPQPSLRFATSMFGMITPGYLAVRDLQKTIQEPTALTKAARMLGLPLETAGHEWPEVRVR